MNYLKVLTDVFSAGIEAFAYYIYFGSIIGKSPSNSKLLLPGYILFTVFCALTVIFTNSNYLLLGLIFVLTLAVSFLHKGGIVVKVFSSIIIIVIGVLTEIIAGIILVAVTQESVEVLSNNIVYYIEGVIFSKGLLLILVGIIKYNKLPVGLKGSKKVMFPLLLLPVVTFFIVFLTSEYAYTISDTRSVVSVAITSAMLILANILVFFVFAKQLKQEDETYKNILVQQQMQYQTAYFKELAEKYKLSNKAVHDTKNQLFAVSIALSKNEIEKAKTKVDEMCNNVFGVYNSMRTGVEALDALLNTKYMIMQNLGISFIHSIFINAVNQVDDTDLCIIIGNAMDNAIEACAKIDGEMAREIELKMMQVSDHLTIEMTNPAVETLKRINGKIVSHKKDTATHGFGLQTMEEIVNKYNGNLSITQNEEKFTLKIYMQNQMNYSKVT